MLQVCRLVVTTGPERGKVFEVEDELVHIGRAAENQIVLDDPSLAEHHASLLRKNGRVAIYRPPTADVQVDGSDIPPEKWVWLPTSVRLQFGRRTSCQFSYDEPSGGAQPANGGSVAGRASVKVPPTVPAAAEGPARRSETESVELPGSVDGSSKKKSDKKTKRKRQLARFITDRGDTLVELGADGQLPELALEDGPAAKERANKPATSSPILLYGALVLSFALSFVLLLVDSGSDSAAARGKAQARREIIRFYGEEGDELKPYQKALRAARLAYSRGDRDTELREYRKVLDELNSEDSNQHLGVTGHLHTDKELKQLIGILISNE